MMMMIIIIINDVQVLECISDCPPGLASVCRELHQIVVQPHFHVSSLTYAYTCLQSLSLCENAPGGPQELHDIPDPFSGWMA